MYELCTNTDERVTRIIEQIRDEVSENFAGQECNDQTRKAVFEQITKMIQELFPISEYRAEVICDRESDSSLTVEISVYLKE